MPRYRVLEDDGPPDRLLRWYAVGVIGGAIGVHWALPVHVAVVWILVGLGLGAVSTTTYCGFYVSRTRMADRLAFIVGLSAANGIALAVSAAFAGLGHSFTEGLVIGLFGTAVLALVWMLLADVALGRLREFIGPGHCPRCGYCLTGLTENRCPECGTPITAAHPPEPGDQRGPGSHAD